MLQAMRNGAGAGILKYFLMGLLVMAVGGLVLMDVGGFFRGGVSSNVVAKGGGIEISAPEFDRTVRRVLARQNVASAEAFQRGMIHMILSSEIQQRLISTKARDMGLVAGDDLTTAQIAKIAEGINPAAGASKADTLKQVLRSQGISESEFVASVRQETANFVLQKTISGGGAVIPAALSGDLYKAENQTRDVEAILLTNDSIRDFDKPDEESLEKYYEANKTAYVIPGTRTVTIATLTRDMIKNRVEISDDELKAEYDNNINAYTKPEMRRLQQAVVSEAGEADAIIAKVKDGKSLKQAAGEAYMGEEAFQESGLLEEIGGPVFSAKEGELIGPIQTALGWHVMVLSKILPPDVTPFDKVKADIKNDIMQIRMMDDLLAAANEIDDRLASGEELEPIVKELGLTTQKLGPFRQNGRNAKDADVLKDYQADKIQIIEAAFDAQPGEAAPIIETADGQFVVVRVDDGAEMSYKPYAEVKDALQKQWISEQQALLNQSRARDAHTKITEGGETLAAVAKELGVKIQTFKKLTKDADAPKALGPLAQTKLFSVNEGEYILAQQEGGIAIAGVTNIDFPSGDKVPADKAEALNASLKRDQGQEMLGLFVSDLTSNTDIKINDALLQQMYAQPIGN